MSPAAFTEALQELGLTQVEAAQTLGVASQQRISEWSRGVRRIPTYITAHVQTLLELHRLRHPTSDPGE